MRKGNDFIITTTDSIPGYRVESYLDTIIIPAIGAAGILRDKIAAITDFSGGRSSAYQKSFNNILESGMKDLQRIARTKGANAVIGLKIESTNISEGRSILSFLLYGTAVVVQPA